MLLVLALTFLIFMFLGMPVAFAILLGAMAAIWYVGDIPWMLVPSKLFLSLNSFPIMAVPFFILAGELMNAGGITSRLVRLATALVGHLRGGLAHVTVVANIIMAGISGSANADAAAIGSVVIPAMRRAGYPAGFTIGIVASAATIGPIIPPSLIMIIYSSVTGMSIGALFLAGFIPGLMVGLALMIMVAYFSHRRNYVRASKRAPLREVLRAIVDSAFALISPVLIIGGILSGAFTATEAGALASVYAFAVGMFYYKEIRLRDLPRLFVSASITTAIGMLIFAMCTLYGFLLARANFSTVAVHSIKMISANPTVVWFLIMALMVFVGMFVEAIAAMIIFVPVLAPLVHEMGYDPLHFALVFIILCLVGSLTPPVGMVLYISCAVGRTPLSEVEIWPFVFAILAVIVVCIFVPQLVLFIPRLFFAT